MKQFFYKSKTKIVHTQENLNFGVGGGVQDISRKSGQTAENSKPHAGQTAVEKRYSTDQKSVEGQISAKHVPAHSYGVEAKWYVHHIESFNLKYYTE